MTIDWWTLGIQTVNVVILVWLLGRFFWRPVAAMIEQRRAASQALLAEAAAKNDQATEALAQIERTRAGFTQEHDAIMATAREAAERARAASVEDATRSAAVLETAALAAIEKEKASTEKAWADRAAGLATDIAGQLAARLGGPAVRAAFLDWLLIEIRALPDQARQAVAAKGMTLEATSATALGPDDQARYRKLIGEAFGAQPEIGFKTDAALIEGLELHGRDFIVSNSWRADLAHILADLAHGNRN
jgi:F-type H+-transporting ATPase subunit b